MSKSSRAVGGPLDATAVPLAPKRVTYAFTTGLANPWTAAAEGRRFFVVRAAGYEAMGNREPGISDGAGVAPARFSLLPRGACGSGVDPRQPLTLQAEFYAVSKTPNVGGEAHAHKRK